MVYCSFRHASARYEFTYETAEGKGEGGDDGGHIRLVDRSCASRLTLSRFLCY
ncbi:hypothetical protein L873DRAFT_1823130, partial [Choiromyces venosus 120613-1]